MRIRDVEWPTGIRDKVERKHGLARGEVESAVLDQRAYIRKARDGRYIVLGRSREGAYVAIAIVYSHGVARVISGRTMTMAEKRTYQKRGK